jgi:hypothetical protein
LPGLLWALLEQEEGDEDDGRAGYLRPGDPLAEEGDRGGHAEDGERVQHHAGRGDGDADDRVVVEQEAGRQGDTARDRRQPGRRVRPRAADPAVRPPLPGEQREGGQRGEAHLVRRHGDRVDVVAEHALGEHVA